MNEELFRFLEEEGVSPDLLAGVKEFRAAHDPDLTNEESIRRRIPAPTTRFYGTELWNQAIAALLCGQNLLLAGPKATGDINSNIHILLFLQIL